MKIPLFSLIVIVPLLGAGALSVPVLAQTSPPPASSPQTPQQILRQNVDHAEFSNADVRDALVSIFRRVGASYSIAPEVQGKISLNTQNVTFETLLENVVRQVDATYRIEGGIFRVVGRNAPALERKVVRRSVLVTLDLQGADVREALRSLFNQAKMPYSIDPEVQGTVTTKFAKTPFDVALQSITRQVDATYQLEAGVVHILKRNEPSVGNGFVPQFNAPIPGEPPIVVQDGNYLYLISSGKIVKIRKSDLKVEREGTLPLRWSTPSRNGG
jgi:type II secretory pathway component GspD/PulD (secretin)